MTQLATSQSVLAPFDGTELQLEGVTWRLRREGREYWVTGTEPMDAGRVRELRKRVVMTTGSHNYQMYWLESDGRGMMPFPLVYLVREKIWIPRKSRFLSPPVERTPIETGRWSVHCIKCHATRGQPHHESSGETRVAELGIACEACHGPGAEHSKANRDPRRRYRLHRSGDPDPTIVNPSRLDRQRSTQVCAQCHAIEIFLSGEDGLEWRRTGTRYRPGDDLSLFQTHLAGRYEDNPPDVRRYIDEHENFELRNCFWPDGTLRVTGREYHALLDTPCYQRGEMTCLSCHDMHQSNDDPRPRAAWADDQLGPEMRGDGACVGCHSRFEDTAAVAAHSHHESDSSGSRCQNCHMPHTTWGLLRAIRSHTVDSPRIDVSDAAARPNACNLCHLDQTLAWTTQWLQEWYGQPELPMSEDQREVPASILWALAGDAVQRALMAWSMGWEPARETSGTEWMVPYLATLLADPYDAVRFNAQRTLGLYPEYRSITANTITGSTKEEQSAMMQRILLDWNERFPDAIDRIRFARLASMRQDHDLILFE